MDWSERFDRLQFNDDFRLNQKIQPLATFELHILVHNGHRLLAFELDPLKDKLSREAFFTCRLKQARA
jgi:hypothetical protein